MLCVFSSASSLPSQATAKQEFRPPKSSTIPTAQAHSDPKSKAKAAQPTSPTDNNKPFKKKMQTPHKQRQLTSTDDEDDDKVLGIIIIIN